MTKTRGRINVFADLKIPHPEAYLAKAELAGRIFKIVKARRLTQAAAGKVLGIPQSKVSALLNGHLDGFSTDRLFRLLNILGCDMQIKVLRPHSETPGRVQALAG